MGLRARLAEAEATLEAIRSGEVDALVVAGPGIAGFRGLGLGRLWFPKLTVRV